MEHCLFISDCHLCDSRPQITQAFNAFLENTAAHAQALYILGDLFEYWAGDDSIAAGQYQTVIQALKNLSASGVKVFFLKGNRDFLVGDGFENATGVTILPDPTLVTLYGKRVLLSHGDALCTDDVAYQQFRNEVRSPAWQAQFLSQPLSKRIAYIEELRTKSEHAKSIKSMQIMDVNAAVIAAILRNYAYPPLFIHGHTHRPQKHLHELDGNKCERWVLGDWYEQGSYLSLSAAGCVAHQLHD
ncbi:MAG: UDP-2,3-diacylglucosamine diphosphatase [Bdellovibrio sp.]|nr:UDP-2,3-diacylglucosamine diphosphatase [Methylotenera sp.]